MKIYKLLIKLQYAIKLKNNTEIETCDSCKVTWLRRVKDS